ncbi:hypothetical protein [Cryobacterium zhongshanensis]|uniref:Uncharacterized protein n=1 Tax=Cryobacterium zhongshanensis TaxID=2928153 RepID=A0AA41QXU9_9MICO|nr:hypothetical protein [Cryobacterium zhongshanensis]MCI4659597.1 hypothetical protein [Cryobacterium zhongshanensis]
MLEQSWLTERLGGESGFPDSTHFGDQSTMSSVVHGFLDNEAGFSDEDVARYINAALQNEAVDIWQGRADGLKTAEAWRVRSNHAANGLDPVGATDAARKRDAILQTMSDRYDLGRTDFASALRAAQESTKAPLVPETCAWVIALDHDGYLSESMGVNTSTSFRANPVLTQMAPRLVDFSRDAEARQPGRESSSGSTRARREAVRSQGRVIDALTQYHPAAGDAAQDFAAEPEVA